MPLHGWTLPLSPDGRASLVPPPPWHFSGDVIGIDYVGDPRSLAAVLPAPLQLGAEARATFLFIDWSSSSEHDPRTMADPARGQYKEAYVAVHATLDGARVARVPYIWVDNDLSLARGLLQGFPKKLGAIAMTKPVAVGRGGPSTASGSRLVGHVSSLGRRLAHGSVTLTAPATEGRVPNALRLPIWHTRLVPDLAGGPPLVNDLARNVLTDFACVDVWDATATLEFGESEFEELSSLAPQHVLGGFRCSIAFTITGAEVRPNA